MQTINISRKLLLDKMNNIHELEKSGHVLFDVNMSKLNDIRKYNGYRTQGIVDHLNELKAEFLEFDGDKIKKDEKGKAVFKEGKTEADYMKLYNEYMAVEVPYQY